MRGFTGILDLRGMENLRLRILFSNNSVLTRRFTDSMTSRKTSFFLYFIASDLHDTALVKAGGGLGAASSL